MKNTNSIPEGSEMYFDKDVVELFAKREENPKHEAVGEIIDIVAMNEIKDLPDPLHLADLGGGAHTDRYHKLFERLLQEPKGTIDWVDFSPYMLDLAKTYTEEKYPERLEAIRFIEEDFFDYLEEIADRELDLVLMKYTLEDTIDLEKLFSLVKTKLKNDGIFIATIGKDSPILKSYSTNARYLFNGEEFPANEVREMKDGDQYTIKFLKEMNKPEEGFLPGAVVTKYYHSKERLEEIAKKLNLDYFYGNWKELIQDHSDFPDQSILVLRKK